MKKNNIEKLSHFIENAEWFLEKGVAWLNRMFQGTEHDYKAKFVSPKDIIKSKHKGFSINGTKNLSLKDSYTNFLISAPVGGGKTTTCILPSLYTTQASMVVHDNSSELIQKSGGYLAKEGIVQSFNPKHPEKSIGFNVLAHVKKESDIQKAAAILVSIALKGKSNDPFWELQARELIVFLIKLLQKLDPKYFNMPNVRHLLFQYAGNPKVMDKLVARYADDAMMSQYRAMLTYGSKMMGSVTATAQSALSIFADPDVARVTSHDSLNLDSFRKRKTTLFINTSVTEASYYEPLTSLLLQSCFSHTVAKLPEKEDLDLLYVIDEAGSIKLGEGNSFEILVSNIRKFRSGVLICTQSAIEQLTEQYGQQGCFTIMQNCMSQLYMSGQSLRTSQHIEKLLGKYTYENDKEQKKHRELMTADEVRTMPKEEAIFIHSNAYPAKVQLTPYYKQSRFRGLENIQMPDLTQTNVPDEVEFININDYV